jgi:hypothetical protein
MEMRRPAGRPRTIFGSIGASGDSFGAKLDETHAWCPQPEIPSPGFADDPSTPRAPERRYHGAMTSLFCVCLAGLAVLAAEPKVAKPSRLLLKLSADTPQVAAGETIRLRLEVRNPGRCAIPIDNGALFARLSDADGKEIAQWPFLDILLVAPGKEAVWSLPAGGRKTVELALAYRQGSWSGFGVPDQTYEGHAIEASYQAGSVIHAIRTLPTTVTIVWRWLADAETVAARARQLAIAPSWSGDVSSNPVAIRLVAGAQ